MNKFGALEISECDVLTDKLASHVIFILFRLF